MAFTVVNSVRGTKEDVQQAILEVQLMGLEALRGQPGFKLGRLLMAEDKSEAILVIEWESRDHFAAYRQSEVGRRLVEHAVRLHPHISFYDEIASF